ncbi:MAG: polysaccharide biosynthesis protein [Clostridia bacterium]|nr:polysaccharide biosynthesis protein [Clostridia bacterium]
MDNEKRKQIYDYYAATGCKIKVYDYPVIQQTGSGRRALREFDVEELLFRKPVDMIGEKTVNYYSGKVVMITGGGGSIGSELARQIAKMQPKRLVLLDVYENGVYDVQQELRLTYGKDLDLAVEIVSVTNENGMRKIFERHRPQLVLHAAAHKHVPLMENNCVEAVENNVFGTLTTVDLSIEYDVEHFIMISTDKAVNPTNVMGATKRMCEMIVMSRSTLNKTSFSATRFGNVLGSAGSVIPLFKRQIAKGGPVTVTDKRIIRYFMTIPEASQLVLTSGQMSKNGELFVLDMGKPVRILDLAENIIRLAGFRPYFDIDILETGLRPGEKLYEELLVKTDELKKTDNDLIFIEEDNPVTKEELDEKLSVLRSAVSSGDDATVRRALRKVVPTYRSPEEVNKTAQKMIDEQTKQ